MFRPTNPTDFHQTSMEIKEWERQRDAKKDDFPYIALSNTEFHLLKSSEIDIVLVTNKNQNSAAKLRDLDLIKIIRSDQSDKRHCVIRDRGRNYLRYIENLKEEKKKSNLHDWKIAVFSVLGAAILSRPLWAGFDWVISNLLPLLEILKLRK